MKFCEKCLGLSDQIMLKWSFISLIHHTGNIKSKPTVLWDNVVHPVSHPKKSAYCAQCTYCRNSLSSSVKYEVYIGCVRVRWYLCLRVFEFLDLLLDLHLKHLLHLHFHLLHLCHMISPLLLHLCQGAPTYTHTHAQKQRKGRCTNTSIRLFNQKMLTFTNKGVVVEERTLVGEILGPSAVQLSEECELVGWTAVVLVWGRKINTAQIAQGATKPKSLIKQWEQINQAINMGCKITYK